jgi:hypothetical protein
VTWLHADFHSALLKLCQHLSCSFDQGRENPIAAMHAPLPLGVRRPLGHAEESMSRMQVRAAVLWLLCSLFHPKEFKTFDSLDAQKTADTRLSPVRLRWLHHPRRPLVCEARGSSQCHPSGTPRTLPQKVIADLHAVLALLSYSHESKSSTFPESNSNSRSLRNLKSTALGVETVTAASFDE